MKKTQYICWSIVLVLFWCESGFGQVLPFRHYTTRDGLQANSVLSLAQDSRGYLWIGTSEGISIFDGATYKNYSIEDGLPGGLVRAILESKTEPGVMWIGTANGLSRFEKEKFTSYTLGRTNQENRVYFMIEDSFGTLWCATDEGVFLFRDGKALQFRKRQIKDWVYRIAEDNNKNIWIGGSEGLWFFERGKDSLHTIRKLPSAKERITAIYPDAEGNVWVTRLDSIIEQFVGVHLTHSFNHGYGYARYILDDKKGQLYLATTNGLLLLRKEEFSSGEVQRIGEENGLPDNDLTRILFDREGNLWLAGNGKGLARVSDRNFYSLSLPGAPIEFEQSKIIVDSYGRYWISSSEGVWEIWMPSKGKVKYYLHRIAGVSKGSFIIPRAFDSQGNLWLSLTSGVILSFSLHRFDEQSSILTERERFVCTFATTAAQQWARGFMIDSKDRAWYAVQDSGIYCVDVSRRARLIKKFTRHDGIPDTWVRIIYEERDGSIWVGGFSRGLSKITWNDTKPIVTKFSIADGLPDGAVRGITQDEQGRIWLGFRYAGIAVLENNHFTHFTLNDGLLSNAVWFVTKDDHKRIWIGTQTGLQSCQSEDFPSFKPKEIISGYRVFSSAIGSDGLVVIMTPDGIAWFNPNRERLDTLSPLIQISGFQVNNIDAELRDGQEFPYDQKNMKFDFVGISYRSENRIHYRYRLLPGEKEWLSPTSERSVTYRSLAPGTYTFQVLCISSEGIESTSPAHLTVTILRPYWQALWFQGGIVIVFGGIIYVLYRYRLFKAIEMERLRTRLASDLHDEIASNLSSIAMYSKIIQDVSYREHEKRELMERISELSQQSVDAIRDIIWAIDPRTETLYDLLIRLKDFLTPSCHAKNIQAHVDIPLREILPPTNLSPQRRKNLWLFLKEALNNSVKHSECTELWLMCSYQSGKCSVEIKDNGKGFDTTHKGEGKGLKTMRMRCEALEGMLEITSQPDMGTKVKIVVEI